MQIKMYPVISINHEILFHEILKRIIYFKNGVCLVGMIGLSKYSMNYIENPYLTLVKIDLMNYEKNSLVTP